MKHDVSKEMAWLDEAIERLTARPVCGYQREGAPAVEPTALAALALLAAGRGGRAMPALDWLAAAQSADGSLGIDADTRQPCWPTGWAILAWSTAAKEHPRRQDRMVRGGQAAVTWTLSISGRPFERRGAKNTGLVATTPRSEAGPG